MPNLSGWRLTPVRNAVSLVIGAQAMIAGYLHAAETELPQGFQSVQGQTNVAVSGSQMQVVQTSNRAVNQWNTFNIGSQASVHFDLPQASSAVLNQVLSHNPSKIFGQLSSNGQVFLSNPNGVIFGRGSRVDLGALVATTHSIAADAFMDGDLVFDRDGAKGAVVNRGAINAEQFVALLAPEVRNEGVIVASPQGTVALAAGERIELVFHDDTLTRVRVEPALIDTLVENKHAIRAPGGQIILSSRAQNQVLAGVINQEDSLDATSLVERGGRILLEGDDILLSAGSEILAAGASGGGEVLVGGDWQGGANVERRVFDDPNALHEAARVVAESGSVVDVSATESGQGGTIVLWSDIENANSITLANGTLLAEGVSAGGQIETSGRFLDVEGSRVSTLAISGQNGDWLLDPGHIFIDDIATDPVTNGSAVSRDTFISDETLESALDAGNVTLQTGGESYDIWVRTPVDSNSSNSLTLIASGYIQVTESITTSGAITLKAAEDIELRASRSITTNGGNLILWSNTDDAGDDGHILLRNGSSLSTGGGNLWMGGGSGTSAWQEMAVGDGYATAGFNIESAESFDQTGWGAVASGIYLENTSINTAGGHVAMYGHGDDTVERGILSLGNLTIDSGDGSILLDAKSNNEISLIFGHHSLRTSSEDVLVSSSNTTSSAITVRTRSENAGSWSYGTWVEGAVRFETAHGGGIDWETRGTEKGINLGFSSSAGDISLLSSSGDISLNTFDRGVNIRSVGSITLGREVGAGVTASSSNVEIIADDVAVAGTNLITIATSGTATLRPQDGSSFARDLVTSGLSLSTDLSGLSLGNADNTRNITVAQDLSVNGFVSLNGAAITINNPITSNGDITLDGTSISGAANLTIGGGGTLHFNQSTNSTYSGIISGAGAGISKSGAGDLTLSGDNTFTGAVAVNAGTLIATHQDALGANAGTVTVANGAGVLWDGINSSAENYVLAGTGEGGLGALSATNGLTLTGTLGITETTLIQAHDSDADDDVEVDLSINGDITYTGFAAGTLTLKSERNLVLGTEVDISSSAGAMGLTLRSDVSANGDGIVMFNGDVNDLNGGALQFGEGTTATISGQSGVLVGGDVYFAGNSAQVLDTDGGDITFNGQMIVANTAGLTIDSDGSVSAGDITFKGLLDSGNIYDFVARGNFGVNSDWTTAQSHALGGGASGSAATSYMVTITSRLENSLAGIAAGYQGAWIGARRQSGTRNWIWSDGPESGLVFFQEGNRSGPTDQPNGSAVSGYYSNFGNQEPNGSGSGAAPTCDSSECYGQFFGAAGLWNDLSRSGVNSPDSAYHVAGYVRETELAGSPLTVNAGTTGNVTFEASIGGSKSYASLSVTAQNINAQGNVRIDNTSTTFSSVNAINIAGNLTGAGRLNFAGGGVLNVGTDADSVVRNVSADIAGNQNVNLFGQDLTLDADIVVSSANTITAKVSNDLILAGSLETTGGSVILTSDDDASGAGTLSINGEFETLGTVTASASSIRLAGGSSSAGWTTNNSALTLSSAVTVENLSANGFEIDTGTAALFFGSTVNSGGTTFRSNLTIAADAVSFGGAVGGSKSLANLLVNGDITATASAITVADDIVLNGDLLHAGSSALTLDWNSGDDIYLNGIINATGSGALSLDFAGPGLGSIIALQGNVTTAGGDISLKAGDINFQATSSQTVNTGGGDLTLTGNLNLAVTNGSNALGSLTLNTGDGDLSVSGEVNTVSSVQRQTNIGYEQGGWSTTSIHSTGDSLWGSLVGVFDAGDAVQRSIDLGGTSKQISFDFYRLASWDTEAFRVYGGGAGTTYAAGQNFSTLTAFDSATNTNSGYTVDFFAAGRAPAQYDAATFSGWDDQKIAVEVTTPSANSITLKLNSALNHSWPDEGWGVKGFIVRTPAESVTGNGTLSINAGAGDVTLTGAVGSARAMGQLDIAGAVVELSSTLNAGDTSIEHSGAGAIDGIISGVTSLTKAGAGTLVLHGDNTHSGQTTIQAGTLQMSHADSLGSGAISVESGGSLNVNGHGISNTLSLAGSGVSDSGAVQNSSGTGATVSSAITLTADTSIKSIQGGALTLSGVVNGAHSLTVDTTANLSLSGVVGGVQALDDLTISTGAGQLSLNNDISLTGSLSANSSSLALADGVEIVASGSDSALSFRATGTIITTGTLSLTAGSEDLAGDVVNTGGNISVLSDTDGSGAGRIDFRQGLVTVDSNGGDITFAGDPDGSGFATGDNEVLIEGVRLRDINIESDGGSLLIKGRTWAGDADNTFVHGAWGVGVWDGNADINVGNGYVDIHGQVRVTDNQTLGKGVYLASNAHTTSITSNYAGTDRAAIHITGRATAGLGDDLDGIYTHRGSDLNLYSTSSVGGGVSLSGFALSSDSLALLGGGNILSAAGDIRIQAIADAAGGSHDRQLQLDNQFYWGSKTGTPVISSTADVYVVADDHSFGGFAPKIRTTGQLDWQSFGASFGTSVNTGWFDWANTASGSSEPKLSGLTIGKATNTADIELGSQDLYLAGDFVAHGGTLNLSRAVTTSGSVNLTASQDINLYANLSASTLSLDAARNVSDATVTVDADNLLILDGTVTLDSATNDFDILAATGFDAIDIHDADALVVGTVGSTTGLAGSGTVDLDVAGNLTLSAAITRGGETTLRTSGAFSQNGITMGGSNLTIESDSPGDLTGASGTGVLSLRPRTSAKNIQFGDVSDAPSGSMIVDQSQLGDFTQTVVGSSTSGDVVVKSLASRSKALTLSSGNNLSVVGDDTNWASDASLTITAQGDITIESRLDFTHDSADLKIYHGGSSASVAASSDDTFEIDLATRGRVRLTGTSPSLQIADNTYAIINSKSGLDSWGRANGSYTALADSFSIAGSSALSAAYFSGTFQGTLEGLGNELSGLTISASGGNLGLFEGLEDATIRNLGITNVDIRTSFGSAVNFGALAGSVGGAGGDLDTGTTLIEGVYSTGTLSTDIATAESTGAGYSLGGGGLIGHHSDDNLIVRRSYSSASVSAKGSYATGLALGGLIGNSNENYTDVGRNLGTLTLDRVYTVGSVIAGAYESYFGTGGIVGVSWWDNPNVSMTNVFSQSAVSTDGGTGVSVGSLVGAYQDGSITNAYASGGASSTWGSISSTNTTFNTARSNGTALSSGYAANVWEKRDGRRPHLIDLPIPQLPIYVRVKGTSSTDHSLTYGDLSGVYTLHDDTGAIIDFDSSTLYQNVSVTDPGEEAIRLTIGNRPDVASYNGVSYLGGLTLTGSAAADYLILADDTKGYLNITARSLSLSGATVDDKVYDGTTDATVDSLTDPTGVLDGDRVSVTHSSAAFAQSNVGDDLSVTVSGISLTGDDAGNYSIGSTLNATADITKRTVSLSASRVYDGTTDLTGDVTLGNLATGENLTHTGATASDANVATTNNYINAITLADGSGLASNYQLPTLNASNAPVTLTTQALTITANDRTRTYGDSLTLGNSDFTQSGLVSGDAIDTVTLTSANNYATTTTTNAGAYGNEVVASAATGASFTASNYAITYVPGDLTIDRRTVTLSANRVYDGTTDLVGDVTLGNLASGESLTYTGATASDANVATANKYISAITLADGTGGLASNYQLPTLNASNAPVTLTTQALTVTANDRTRTYGDSLTLGNTAFTQSGLVSGDAIDTVTLTSANNRATTTTTNVGTYGDEVVISAATGASFTASNYAIIYVPADLTIDRRTVTLSVNRVYDGTTDLAGDVTLGNLASGESLTYTGATASDANVATANKYISAITLADGTGGLASNYQLPTLNASNAPVTLTTQALTVTANDRSRTYGDSLTLGNSDFTQSGLVSGDAIDTVTLTSANSYATTTTAIAGTHGDEVVVSAATGASFTASNYAITYEPGDLTIDKRTTTVTVDSSQGKIYGDSDTALTYTSSNNASGETLSGLLVRAPGENVGSYAITANTLTNANNTNYDITFVGADYVITPRTVTLSASRVYDGTTDLTGDVTLGNLVSGESLTYTGATASDANVATANKYISAINLDDGTDGLASNYQLPTLNGSNSPVTVSTRSLTASLDNTGITKVYDATDFATSGFVANIGHNAVSGETPVFSYTGAAFNSPNVADANTLTLSGLRIESIEGGAASNYSLAASTISAAATITPAPLSVVANNDARFVAQSDSSNYAGVSYSGFVGGQNATDLTGTPTVSRSNSTNLAGNYSDVLVPAGLSSSNYDITFENGDYTIVPAGQLLVVVDNLTETYGTGGNYSLSKISYFDTDTNTEYRLDDSSVAGSSVTQTGNSVAVDDGRGATASFTLAPVEGNTSGAGELEAGAYQITSAGAALVSGSNFSNTITVTGAHQVSTRAVVASAGSGLTKVYDGTTAMTNLSVDLTGLLSGDDVTSSGIGAFAQANLGSGISYSLTNLQLANEDASNYHLAGGSTLSGSTGVITARPVTVTATDLSKVYGENDAPLVYTVESAVGTRGLLSGDSVSGALTRVAGENVGSYAINQGTVALNGNYDINYVAGDYTIAQRAITLSADSKTQVFGDSAETLSVSITAGGLATDAVTDSLSDVTGTLSRESGANVGQYDVALGSGSAASNYDITFDTDNDAYAITPRIVTLSASRVYDGTTDLTGDVTLGNLATGESLTYTGATASDANVATTNNYISDITLADGTGLASNYQLPMLNASNAPVTLTTTALTVTANDRARTYGDSLTLGNMAFTQNGLVSGDAIDTVTLTSANNRATTTTTNAGTYSDEVVVSAATGASFTASNYAITYVPGDLTVDKRATTVAVDSNQAKTYGEADTALTYTSSNNASGETLSGSLVRALGEDVGSYAITANTLTNANNTNYDITFVSADYTIARRPITLSADSKTQVYGNSAETLSVAITAGGLATDAVTDSLSAVTGTLSRESGANVGQYDVALGSGSAASNYDITFTTDNNAYVITPRIVTLSASRVYDGTTDLTGDVILGNLATGENLTYSGATANSARVADSENYISAITLTDGSGLSSNYQLPALNASNAPVSLSAKTLTVSATNTGVTKVYDTATSAPAGLTPTYSVTGLVSGDSIDLSHAAKAYDSADVSSASSITVSGLAILSATGSAGSVPSDYQLASSSVTMAASVTPAPLTITANDDAIFVAGDAEPSAYAGVQYDGLVGNETSAVLGGVLAFSRSNAGVNLAGHYEGVIVPAGLTSSNYDITFENGDFTIVAADQLLVQVVPVTDVYGTATQYQLDRVAYYNGSTVVELGSGTGARLIDANNAVSISDGSGGTADFTLRPVDESRSTANLLEAGTYTLEAASLTAQNSLNFSNSLVVVGNHQVNTRSLSTTVSAGHSKIYDGDNRVDGLGLSLTGVLGADSVSVAGQGLYTDKNVQANKAFQVDRLVMSGDDYRNYHLDAMTLSALGSITQRELDLTITGVDRTYNGNVQANVQIADNRVAGDVLSIQRTATFADKNVGSAKAVSVTGIQLTGDDSNNYSVVNLAATQAHITRLASVQWTGGAGNNNWFDPANWTGGAVPDLANVARVVIPDGVSVQFGLSPVVPAQTGVVDIASLQGGSVVQNAGTLNVANAAVLEGLTQSGGIFTAGSLTITQNYQQTGGQMTVSDDAVIRDNTGGVVLGDATVGGKLTLTSTDGVLSQSAGTSVNLNAATITATERGSAADVNLNVAQNELDGAIAVSGRDVRLADATGTLTLADIEAQSLTVVSGGNITQEDGSRLNIQGATRLSASGLIDLPSRDNQLRGALVATGSRVLIGGSQAAKAATRAAMAMMQQASQVRVVPLQVAPQAPAAIVTSGASASGSSTSGATPSAPNGGAGIVVETLVRPNAETSGLVIVQVPEGTAVSGTGFVFDMPAEITEVANAIDLRISMPDGSRLPSWLSFDPVSMQFTADAVPEGSLPLALRISMGDQQMTIVVSERIEQAAVGF